MPHILFINQHYYPDFAATGQLLAELCEDLVRFGFKITVITGMPEKGTFPSEAEIAKIEQHKNLTIYRIDNHPAGNKTIINRLIHFVSFWLGSIIKALFLSEKYDYVFVMSTPPLLNGLTANLLRIFRSTPYVYNVQDLYPGIAVEMGTIKNKWLIRLSESIETYINRHALVVTTLSSQMKYNIQLRTFGKDIRVIPNWSDSRFIFPLEKSELRDKLNLNEKFLVTYSGNMGLSQGLDQLLDVAGQLQNQMPVIHFLFIGNGAHLPQLKSKVEQLQLSNVTFLPFQPKEKLNDGLNAADLHIVSTQPNMAKYLMPSKIYGIMAAGKAVLAIAEKETEMIQMIEKFHCGISAQPNKTAESKEQILWAFQNPSELATLGKNGRKAFLQNFDRFIATQNYASLFENIYLKKENK